MLLLLVRMLLIVLVRMVFVCVCVCSLIVNSLFVRWWWFDSFDLLAGLWADVGCWLFVVC